jgi:hypothetical protein
MGRFTTSSAAKDLTEAPAPKLLGTVDPKSFEDDGQPPWESDPKWTKDNTNARRYVDVPDEWELRWLNPRQIDHSGFRDWRAVPAGHERIIVKNRSMIAADNTIRKGGHDGMLLAYMPKSWVASRLRLKEEHVERRTQSAVDRQKHLQEQVNRGGFGPNMRVESIKHPTHTSGLAPADRAPK